MKLYVILVTFYKVKKASDVSFAPVNLSGKCKIETKTKDSADVRWLSFCYPIRDSDLPLMSGSEFGITDEFIWIKLASL